MKKVFLATALCLATLGHAGELRLSAGQITSDAPKGAPDSNNAVKLEYVHYTDKNLSLRVGAGITMSSTEKQATGEVKTSGNTLSAGAGYDVYANDKVTLTGTVNVVRMGSKVESTFTNTTENSNATRAALGFEAKFADIGGGVKPFVSFQQLTAPIGGAKNIRFINVGVSKEF